MKKQIILAALSALLLLGHGITRAADEKFTINRFDVQGNTLLPKAEVDQVVAPFTGKDKVYGDVQKALEALERTYHSKGYGTVSVFVPEQELASGVVRLQVAEGIIGKVTVTGNKYFSTENVRAALPQLQEGKAPNLSLISDNVQFSNEVPAKKVEVTLGVSEEEGKVDAKVAVSDENPRRVYVTVDNTGEKPKTGQYRTGLSYRDANLFGHDETLTLGYITAPDAPGGVNVEVYTVGLRIPFYSLGDSLDLIAAKSTVNIPASVIAPGGTLSLNGKGTIFAARWNHLFPREGEYTSRVVLGLDWKDLENPCKGLVNAGCIGLLETPVSATYVGQWQKPNVAADFNAGLAYNLMLRERQSGWRYNYAANARSTQKDFLIFRAGGSYLQSLPGDWQVRGALNAQYSDNPLPTTEQLGLTGAQAVRGFNERVLTSDSGFVANIEGYTPDLVPLLGPMLHTSIPGALRALAFYDTGLGWSRPVDGTAWFDPHSNLAIPAGTRAINERTTIESIGLGLRYGLRKDISARFDYARILQSSPANRLAPNVPVDDQWRIHFAVVYGF